MGAHQGHLEEDHGCQEGGGQEGEEGGRKGQCARDEEEGRWHFRAQGPFAGVGNHLRWEEDGAHGGYEEDLGLSPALATICGGKKMARTEVTKKIWVYIKKNNLNQGRTIKPDSTLKAIFPVASIDMLKMAGYVSKHLS